MTRIKLNTSIAGERFSYAPREIVDWPDDAEAARLVAAGFASLVEATPAPEIKTHTDEPDADDETADAEGATETAEAKGKRRKGKAGK